MATWYDPGVNNPEAIKRRASANARRQRIPRGKYWFPDKPGLPGQRLPIMPRSTYVGIRRRNMVYQAQRMTESKLPWLAEAIAGAQARKEYAEYKQAYTQYWQQQRAAESKGRAANARPVAANATAPSKQRLARLLKLFRRA